jgi:hypothetical protein
MKRDAPTFVGNNPTSSHDVSNPANCRSMNRSCPPSCSSAKPPIMSAYSAPPRLPWTIVISTRGWLSAS